MAAPPIPFERINHAIFEIRGHKVMLDSELAALYGVETKLLLLTPHECNVPLDPGKFHPQLRTRKTRRIGKITHKLQRILCPSTDKFTEGPIGERWNGAERWNGRILVAWKFAAMSEVIP
jgi:hypothetical protein